MSLTRVAALLLVDPYELNNTASGLSPERVQQLHSIVAGIQACQGTTGCWNAQKM